ncbi:MAG TPA: response regulator transcription factor [Chloroflexota bacterium]|nr:response regulator transcription factor [Chloroflexota bacterium]
MPGAGILIIADEQSIEPSALVRGLAQRDLLVSWAHNAEEALQHLARELPRVILLDLAVVGNRAERGPAGLRLCQRLRFLTQAPILLLGTPEDKPLILDALNLGADAFLFKPVDVDLLVAALGALRRWQPVPEEEPQGLIRVRDLEIDHNRYEVRLRGEPVSLTPTEFRILSCLARNLGRVVSARKLLQEAQGYPCTEREAQQIVKVHVRHLRAKLPPPAGEQSYIANVRGFGYILERRAVPRRDDLVATLSDES